MPDYSGWSLDDPAVVDSDSSWKILLLLLVVLLISSCLSILKAFFCSFCLDKVAYFKIRVAIVQPNGTHIISFDGNLVGQQNSLYIWKWGNLSHLPSTAARSYNKKVSNAVFVPWMHEASIVSMSAKSHSVQNLCKTHPWLFTISANLDQCEKKEPVCSSTVHGKHNIGMFARVLAQDQIESWREILCYILACK